MSGNSDSSSGTHIHIDHQPVTNGGVGVNVNVLVGGRPVSTLLDLGPLFGRADDLAAIDGVLKNNNTTRLILSGEPGIGKTHLANAYGASQKTRYPGGMFFIAFNADPGLRLANLISPMAGEPIVDRAGRMLASIEKLTLLIYDNVPSEHELMAWLPPAGVPVHVLVTTTCINWTRRHTVRNVQPLDATDAQTIIEGVAGQDIAREYGEALIRRAEGIAVRLRADCDYVVYEVRLGRTPALDHDLDHNLDSATKSSFAQTFAMLTPDGQLAMHVAALFNQAHIPQTELEHRLASLGWNEQRRQEALDSGINRRLLSKANGFFRMHGLLTDFVRSQSVQPVPKSILDEHREGFIELARTFIAQPARTELREQLAGYPKSGYRF